MATKTISGSPLKRVLNRSLTWKETYNVVAETVTGAKDHNIAAPESVTVDRKYAAALKAFESIPNFPDEWDDLQQSYVKLSTDMRTVEDTPVKAEKTVRDAHSLLIDQAKTDADELATAVRERLQKDKDAAGRGLARIGVELREFLVRLGDGDAEIDADLDYVAQLKPAVSALGQQTGALDMISGRHAAIQQFMVKRSIALTDSIEKLVAQARAAVKQFDELRACASKWKKLQADGQGTERPPSRKQFSSLYANDASAMEKARVEFEETFEKLSERKDKIVAELSGGKVYFGGTDFAALNDQIHQIASMDKLRLAEERQKQQAERSSKEAKKPTVVEAEDPPPPRLPPRPRDASAGRTIAILNPGLEPSSVLTHAEENKHADFLRLDNHVIAHRVRDTMNDVFGNFEFVQHQTVRLSRRRRLEFDMDMSVGGQVRITLVNIGDPTYEH
jgi:hypothetical protein